MVVRRLSPAFRVTRSSSSPILRFTTSGHGSSRARQLRATAQRSRSRLCRNWRSGSRRGDCRSGPTRPTRRSGSTATSVSRPTIPLQDAGSASFPWSARLLRARVGEWAATSISSRARCSLARDVASGAAQLAAWRWAVSEDLPRVRAALESRSSPAPSRGIGRSTQARPTGFSPTIRQGVAQAQGRNLRPPPVR